jgi:heat shock protein HslJ
MSIRSLLAAGIAAFALVASAPALAREATPEASSDLTTFVWELVELQTGPNSSATPDDPLKYTIGFNDDGTVSIVADCNVGSGTYTVDRSKIAIKVGPMTLAACPEDSLSDQWIKDLGQVVTLSINDASELVLNLPADAGFIRLAPSLTGVVWEWTGLLSMNDTTVTPDDPSHYTIEFLNDGTIAIGADCNRGRGNYTRDGSSIDMNVTALTRAYCGEESLSDDFIGYINDASSLVFQDGQLHLALPMDGGILSFSPQLLAPAASPEAGQ